MISINVNDLEKIGNGISNKKIYKINDDRLFIDFSQCNNKKYEIFNINYIPNDTELKRFVNINIFLEKNSCNVPKIYEYNNDKMILQNLGNNTLLHLGLNNLKYGTFQKALYKSIDWLIKLSNTPYQQNDYIVQRIYNATTLTLETQKFINTTLSNINLSDKINLESIIEIMIESIFINSKKCLIHRDFQSGNLIYCDDKLYAIDFQDSCLGIDLYDLVSLLYDLKISLSQSEKENLIQYYLKNSNIKYNNNVRQKIYLLATLRLCKSLTYRIKKYNENKNNLLLLEIKKGYNLLHELSGKLSLYKNFFDIIFKYLPTFDSNLISIILAAGKGTRMLSEKPKVLHYLFNNYLVEYPLRLSKLIGSDKVYTIVGYQAQNVINSLNDRIVKFIEQKEQLGTGHAVMQVTPYLENNKNSEKIDVLVLMGDCVALSYEIINNFICEFRQKKYSAGLLTSNINESARSSRVIRNSEGNYLGSVEFKDMTEEHKGIRETGCGIMIFKLNKLLETLPKLNNNNKQGEYYLPDVINILVKNGDEILAYKSDEIPETHGANTQNELKELEELLS